MKRLEDRLQAYNIFLMFFAVTYITIKTCNNEMLSSIEYGGISILIAIQILNVAYLVKACNRRYDFSSKVSNAILKCYFTQNAIPTSKAIEDYKEQLRREINVKIRKFRDV